MNNIETALKKTLRTAALAAILVTVIISYCGCGMEEPVSDTGFYLDTQCDVTIYGLDGDEGEETLKNSFDTIRNYEELLSRTFTGSDTERINGAGGKAVKVDPETAEVIKEGLNMGRISDGKFDITIGRVTEMWDFKSENPSLPDSESLKQAVETVDYKGVILSGSEVRLKDHDAAIDLGGIAKGFIADRLAQQLQSSEVTGALINLGGNVEAIGTKPGGEPFVIGIERPYSNRTEIIGTVEISDQTVVTSGVYERKFEKEGTLYHHILDPRTGYPAETDLESVTIIADKGNSCFCDGLATSCLMLGSEKAEALMKQMQEEYPEKNISGILIDRDDKMISIGDPGMTPVDQ